MSETVTYIRAKQFLPNINYLYCNATGNILDSQTKPTDGTIVDNVSDDEIMSQLREYRNQLLVSSDWTQLPDVPLDADAILAWKNYRQQLRDFPDTIDLVDWTGPDWPTPPS